MPNQLSIPGGSRLEDATTGAARFLPLVPRQNANRNMPPAIVLLPHAIFQPANRRTLGRPLDPVQAYFMNLTYPLHVNMPPAVPNIAALPALPQPGLEYPQNNQRMVQNDAQIEEIFDGDDHNEPQQNRNVFNQRPWHFNDMTDPIMQGVGRPFNLDYINFGQALDHSIHQPISALLRPEPPARRNDTTTLLKHTIRRKGNVVQEKYCYRVTTDNAEVTARVERNRSLRLYERYGPPLQEVEIPEDKPEEVITDIKRAFEALVPWQPPNNIDNIEITRTGEPNFINDPLQYMSENAENVPDVPAPWSYHTSNFTEVVYLRSPTDSSLESSFSFTDSDTSSDSSNWSNSSLGFQARALQPEMEGRSSIDADFLALACSRDQTPPLASEVKQQLDNLKMILDSNLQMRMPSSLIDRPKVNFFNMCDILENADKSKYHEDSDPDNSNMEVCVKNYGLLVPTKPLSNMKRPTNNCPSLCHKIITNKDPTFYFCTACGHTETDYQFPDENQLEGAETLSNQIEKMKHAILKQPIVQFEMTCAKPNDRYVVCSFCRTNSENETFYRSHRLKDCKGRVVCPVLRLVECPYCYATGDTAHTKRYCPYYTIVRENLPCVRRLANGVLAQATHHK